jgi:hypothetical protein
VSGVLFGEQTVDALSDAVEGFRDKDFMPTEIARHARRFSRDVFVAGMRAQIAQLMG